MADITITDKQVNSAYVSLGIGCLFFAVGASGYTTYTLWFGDQLTHEGHTGYISQMSMLVLFCLSLGLLLIHLPKDSEYEEKEEEQD